MSIVAIIGRPNVGKSTLFNKLAGRRLSIVDNMPGVTRDRIYADVEWCGKAFTLIDTGGIEIKSEDKMLRHIRKQVEIAIETADVLLFMTDGKSGVSAEDFDVATLLRKTEKPVVLAVNKIDSRDNSAVYDFYNLQLGTPNPISAEQSLGLGDLLDEITKHFPKEEGAPPKEGVISIAVVGKPNSGKSSLVNKILGYDRAIVSDVSGTTRDALDTPFSAGGKDYILIDTAGIRKKSKVNEDVEYYSVIRAISAIKRADAVLCVIDAVENISEQDVKILGLIHEAGKPSVIVMNKWDLAGKDAYVMNEYNEKLKRELKFMDYFKAVYVSALTGKRVNVILDAVQEVYQNASRRITTGLLNDVLGDAVSVNEPPHKNGKKLKIYYMTQASANPPAFILFVNEPDIMHFSYKRYLENAIRKAFDFTGTPIRIFVRNNSEASN
jgi:GTP-binding protein